MYAYLNAGMHVCMHVIKVLISIYIIIYICMHINMYVSIEVCLHNVVMYVSMYVYLQLYVMYLMLCIIYHLVYVYMHMYMYDLDGSIPLIRPEVGDEIRARSNRNGSGRSAGGQTVVAIVWISADLHRFLESLLLVLPSIGPFGRRRIQANHGDGSRCHGAHGS